MLQRDHYLAVWSSALTVTFALMCAAVFVPEPLVSGVETGGLVALLAGTVLAWLHVRRQGRRDN